MHFEVYFRPEAESDIDQARDYYNEIRPGLGDDYLLCVDEAISNVRRQLLCPVRVNYLGRFSDVCF